MIAVGLVGGLVGAAYMAVLNVMTRVLGPVGRAPLTHLFVFIGVGLAVAAITHFWGETGGVELLAGSGRHAQQ